MTYEASVLFLFLLGDWLRQAGCPCVASPEAGTDARLDALADMSAGTGDSALLW